MDGSYFEPIRVASGYTHRIAVHIIADNTHFPLHDIGVEGFVSAYSGVEEAGIVGNSMPWNRKLSLRFALAAG